MKLEAEQIVVVQGQCGINPLESLVGSVVKHCLLIRDAGREIDKRAGVRCESFREWDLGICEYYAGMSEGAKDHDAHAPPPRFVFV